MRDVNNYNLKDTYIAFLKITLKIQFVKKYTRTSTFLLFIFASVISYIFKMK